MSATTTRAPSLARRRTVARPIPLPPPVTTATRPCNLMNDSSVVGDEHVLGLGERRDRVRAELPAEAGLLETAERRPVPHRRVGVDRQITGFDTTGHAQRAAHV